MGNEKCACWFACMNVHFDVNECISECGNDGDLGQLVSCSASECNDDCIVSD